MHPDLFWERFRVKPGMTAGTTLRRGLDDSRNDISLDRDEITTKALVWYNAARFTSGQAIGHRIKLLRERFRVKPGMTSRWTGMTFRWAGITSH